MTHVGVEEGKLLIDSPLAGTKLVLVPVDGMQFRQISEPIATAKLLAMDDEGKFIQLHGGMMTMKRIPGWAALTEMMLAAWTVLAMVSVLLYMPFWLLGCIGKNYFHPGELSILGFPLLAASSVAFMVGIGFVVSDSGDTRVLLGNLTIWSGEFSWQLLGLPFLPWQAGWSYGVCRNGEYAKRSAGIQYGLFRQCCLPRHIYEGVIGLRIWA